MSILNGLKQIGSNLMEGRKGDPKAEGTQYVGGG